MSLSKIIEEINVVKLLAEEVLDESKFRETLRARRGIKNQSIDRLAHLKRQYQKELLDSAIFIVVTGDKKDSFVSVATEKFKCFSANPNELYEDLANSIPEALYKGKESLTGIFDILGRYLEDKATDLNLAEYNQLIFKSKYQMALKDKADLVSLIRTAINEQIGSEIVGIQAIASLTNTAIDKGHGLKVIPVVLPVEDELLALSLESSLKRLRTRGVHLVTAGKSAKALKAVSGSINVKDPTDENVELALTNISNSVKKV